MAFVRFDQLPWGVHPVKDYRSLGVTLVECYHDPRHRVELASPHQRTFCRICRTVDPGLPVKLLAHVPTEAALF